MRGKGEQAVRNRQELSSCSAHLLCACFFVLLFLLHGFTFSPLFECLLLLPLTLTHSMHTLTLAHTIHNTGATECGVCEALCH